MVGSITDQIKGRGKSSGHIRAAVLVTAVMVVLAILSLIVLNEYYLSVDRQNIVDTAPAPLTLTLPELRAAEDETLNSYSLLDSAGLIYRIPIDLAIDLIAERAEQKSFGRQNPHKKTR